MACRSTCRTFEKVLNPSAAALHAAHNAAIGTTTHIPYKFTQQNLCLMDFDPIATIMLLTMFSMNTWPLDIGLIWPMVMIHNTNTAGSKNKLHDSSIQKAGTRCHWFINWNKLLCNSTEACWQTLTNTALCTSQHSVSDIVSWIAVNLISQTGISSHLSR